MQNSSAEFWYSFRDAWGGIFLVGIVIGGIFTPTVAAVYAFLAPLFLPIAKTMGIDPIHLGIIMVVNMEIGLITYVPAISTWLPHLLYR